LNGELIFGIRLQFDKLILKWLFGIKMTIWY
jgi:hypothetical protein